MRIDATPEEWARVTRETHVFQAVRPHHPAANAVCARCGLALPHGPILAIGPGSLPPCVSPPPAQQP